MRLASIVAAAAIMAAASSTTSDAQSLEVAFSIDEIATIRAYFGHESRAQPPRSKGRGNGGGRSGGLPPGIARNLERGKPLPPGIAKQHLPAGLVAELPPPPDGFERIILDGKILLVEIATQVIHDVLTDVLLDR
jgi:Ni/Co efflux regulator RcnB